MLACSSDKGTVHIFKLRKEVHDVEHGALALPPGPGPDGVAGGAGAGGGMGGASAGALDAEVMRREEAPASAPAAAPASGAGSAAGAPSGGGIAPSAEGEEGSNKSRCGHGDSLGRLALALLCPGGGLFCSALGFSG
jgi:hypothetical protein